MRGGLWRTFRALERQRGEWTLFAALLRPAGTVRPWHVAVAAPWLVENGSFDNMRLVLDTLGECLPTGGLSKLGSVLILVEPADVAAALRSLTVGRILPPLPRGTVLRNFGFRGRTYRRGYVWAASLPAASVAPVTAA